MTDKTQAGAQRKDYLLGGGTEANRELLEAEFFADDDVFQEMLTAEDDVIDAYARGELSDSERRQFEGRFLTSVDGRGRVQFAQAFAAASAHQTITHAPVGSTPTPNFLASIFGSAIVQRAALATIAIAVIVPFSWLLVERSRTNTELTQLRAERERLNQKADELQRTADAERLRNAETLAQLKDLQDRSSASGQDSASPAQGSNKRNTKIDNVTVANNRSNEPVAEDNAFFDVNPISTRGGSRNTLKTPANTRSITLRLGLEKESSQEDYRASISSANGRLVKMVEFKVTNAPHDVVQLPAISTTSLRPGDYVIDLMAKQPAGTFERVASYSFRVAQN